MTLRWRFVLFVCLSLVFSCEEEDLKDQTCWENYKDQDESLALSVSELQNRLTGEWELYCISNQLVGVDREDFEPQTLVIFKDSIILQDNSGINRDTLQFIISERNEEKYLELKERSNMFAGGLIQLRSDEISFGDGRVDHGVEYYTK